MDVACRFAETGCRSPAVEIIHVPQGCICWRDPVQALCEQHLLTIETTGPSETLLDLRTTASNKWGVPKACVHGVALTDGCDGCVADADLALSIETIHIERQAAVDALTKMAEQCLAAHAYKAERDALHAKLQEIHRLLIFPQQSGN